MDLMDAIVVLLYKKTHHEPKGRGKRKLELLRRSYRISRNSHASGDALGEPFIVLNVLCAYTIGTIRAYMWLGAY